MGLATVFTRADKGIDAPLVRVEVHIANGLPTFQIVGLAETAVKESRDRVRSAITISGFEFPAKRIIVNLAPADIPKSGGRYDLPIAIGILVAAGYLSQQAIDHTEFIGELSLEGEIREVNGLIPIAMACHQLKHVLVLAETSSSQVTVVEGLQFLLASSLTGLFNHFAGHDRLELQYASGLSASCTAAAPKWDDIIGQEQAKRGLIIAAAGGHNLLFVGPPGTGKSLLASRMVSLLPELSIDHALEVAAVYSVKGETRVSDQLASRPFRHPHHTSSAVALTGGGSVPSPGEISLAHRGVLFLDELPEFGRQVLDVLREPLETGEVTVSRAKGTAIFPAQFQLIAAMNPSPTGAIDDGRSTHDQIIRYLNRLSGPLLDRIDLQIDVLPLSHFSLKSQHSGGIDSAVKAKHHIQQAQDRQYERQGKLNAHLSASELAQYCHLDDELLTFLADACDKLKLSMRVFHRTIKVARTLADLNQDEDIQRQHLGEALGYRAIDNLIRQLS